ncbi:heavy-metal-associated domain-containing protein [Acidithiobacillus sp. CV18-2]|nr:heavy-metal-associated domain-containing protein [Acidithiobacillus sp. CV18-3]MBU2758561.1 heavy-metal-associated domain-containing protein [Acidithiobacillus sp. BN09-2]MBU2776888.1 heavy-metal-associated domain-containing protein [Acidithiobacillus sp. CV18-2]MBU2800046.1 heavy-metal-associated domain-containing protein [Acidithiobacillus sp. VAN18-4]
MNIRSFSVKAWVLLAVAASLGSGAALIPADAAAVPAVATAKAAYASTVFKVPSMTCTDKACETAIYIALHRLKGVKTIRIDDMAQTVTVMYAPKLVDAPMLLHTFKRVGYPASVVHG